MNDDDEQPKLLIIRYDGKRQELMDADIESLLIQYDFKWAKSHRGKDGHEIHFIREEGT